MGGTHSCSRASLPMRWSVDGRHPLLLTCLSAHALERGWEAPTLAHVPLCPCARAWMGGTHSCSRVSLPMQWSVDGRHPLLLTCLSAHALERGWEAPTPAHVPLCPCAGAWMGGTHSCSRVSLPMRWSVDGRHPPLLTCLSAHALERGWEAPTLAHVPLCPCAGAWMGGTHSCSRASLPMRWSVDGRHPLLLTCLSAHALEQDGRHPLLLTCLSAHALEHGWEAPTLAHVPLCPCARAWMGGTHSCSRVSLPMQWSVDGRHPLLLTCLSAHALERGWEAPTPAHVPLCPCAGAWMAGTHSCSRASLPMRWSVDGRHPLLLTCLSAHALERGWEAPTLAHVPLCPCAGAWMGGTHSCSRASLPMRWSVDGRHPLLLTCLSAHAMERGWEAPLLLTCLSAHALERGWEAPTLAHVPLCPCDGAWMGGTHSCSRASLPMR